MADNLELQRLYAYGRLGVKNASILVSDEKSVYLPKKEYETT